MSPVNRAGSVSEISPHYSFSFEKFRNRDLGFYERDLKFSHAGMKIERSRVVHLGNLVKFPI